MAISSYDLDDMAPVGTSLLVRVNQHAGTAEFGLTIGERRNLGLGTEATRLVLDWALRYDLKLWIGSLHESATYPPA
jgi:RimJ/RimL family protein N-acetyltransferase